MSSPQYRWKPLLACMRMFLSSLWPLLVLVFPVLLAMQSAYGLSLAGVLLAVIPIVVVIALGVVAALGFLFLVAWILYFLAYPLGKGGRLLGARNLALSAGTLFGTGLFFVWDRLTTIDLIRFFQARRLDLDVPDLSPIIDQFSVFPTHHVAMFLHLARTDDLAAGLVHTLVPLALLLGAILALFVLSKHHLVLWEIFEEHVRAPRNASRSPFLWAGSLFSASSPPRAMFEKEVIAFLRNTRGILWFGFLVLIWLIQVGAWKIIARGLGAERVAADALPAFVGMFHFAVITYFVSMFVLRFVFPSFSTERKTAWLIAASPVDLRIVFISKLRFFVTLFSVLAVAFALIGALVAGLSLVPLALLIVMLLVATLFLSVFGLALGAIFPNFESDDPEVLSTTLPGLGFIFGALLYGALGAYALGDVIRGVSPLPVLVFLALSLVVAAYISRTAERSLVRMEF